MEFTKILREQYKLSSESIALLSAHLQPLSFGRKEIVVREGERNDFAYFVEKGSVRSYVLRDGNYVMLSFAFDGEAAVSTLGLSGDPTAKTTIETLEPSTLYKISRQQLESLFAQSAELASWARRIMEKRMLDYEHYFAEYFWADKGTQYLKFLREYPELLQRISLKELASYLNVTPQTLSRIRAKIK